MRSLNYLLLAAFVCLLSSPSIANPVKYEGNQDVAKNKHIVFVASDHEYRGEETLPALARILAKHHGFDCTVLFGLDENGEIKAGESNIPGLEALESADAMIMFTRFQALPDEQMKHIDAYLNRGGPVMGLRTSTHGFKYGNKESAYAKYDFKSETKGYENGFGHQVLGQTWVGHYGRNHQQSTRITIVPEAAKHPILTGVKDVHIQCGGYNAEPADDWNILTMAQPLMSMEFDGEPDASKPPMASEWTREYSGADGAEGRVFTSLYGASEDILNPGYRRMLVNATYWLLGLEDQIKADAPIDFVGKYQPNTFRGGGYARGVKPSMYDGFESPIPANNNTGPEKKKGKVKPAWKSIFDGKSLKGWHQEGDGNWVVEDGAIVGKTQEAVKLYGLLVSDNKYKNVRVKFAFKSLEGNSGFYVRGHIKQPDKAHGLQVEVDPRNSTGGIYESYGRGWVSKPDDDLVKKAYKHDEWNEMEILAEGGHVVTRLNGTKIAEIENDPVVDAGHLIMQMHSGNKLLVMFKDIQVVDLDQKKAE